MSLEAKPRRTQMLLASVQRKIFKKNARILSFSRGHRDGNVPRIEWDQCYLHMLLLLLEHPKEMLAESKQMTESLNTYIYIKFHQDFMIGDAALSAEQQIALKTRSLCLPLLADNPWEPSAINEDDLIIHLGIDTIPEDGSDKRIKHDNTVVRYSSRAMHGLSQRNSESHVPKNGIQQ
jgi:hypothetical protein